MARDSVQSKYALNVLQKAYAVPTYNATPANTRGSNAPPAVFIQAKIRGGVGVGRSGRGRGNGGTGGRGEGGEGGEGGRGVGGHVLFVKFCKKNPNY